MRLHLSTLAAALLTVVACGAPPKSGSVTTESATRLSGTWSVYYGSADVSASIVAPPDGSSAMEFTAQASGSIVAQLDLPHPVDVRTHDSFTVWAQATATHIGDFVYLVDVNERRRWYSLLLWSQRGWLKPVFWLNAFVGQDSGFDAAAVAKIRYAQAAQAIGDKLRFSAPSLERDIVNHGDAASPWYVDIGTGTLSVVQDGAAGTPTSLKAVITANANGQADIAINLIAPRITWDWSGKSFSSFYFKDDETIAKHYFLVYDKNLNYRQWVFHNSTPGEWFQVTADLANFYTQSGPVDLSQIVYWEVGVFGGRPNATYTFQVDEVAAY